MRSYIRPGGFEEPRSSSLAAVGGCLLLGSNKNSKAEFDSPLCRSERIKNLPKTSWLVMVCVALYWWTSSGQNPGNERSSEQEKS